MKAKVGDWLVIKGTTIEQHEQRGLITEVHAPDGAPPYVVRWLANDHEATVFPGPDAVIVTAAEQADADRRARDRFGAVQSAIAQQNRFADWSAGSKWHPSNLTESPVETQTRNAVSMGRG